MAPFNGGGPGSRGEFYENLGVLYGQRGAVGGTRAPWSGRGSGERSQRQPRDRCAWNAPSWCSSASTPIPRRTSSSAAPSTWCPGRRSGSPAPRTCSRSSRRCWPPRGVPGEELAVSRAGVLQRLGRLAGGTRFSRSIRRGVIPDAPAIAARREEHMTTRSIVAALVVALTLMAHAPASAQQAKCLAGKTACMAKKAAGLLKCEALAETPGKPADPNDKDCVTKVQTKFGSGLEPAKGCFEKVESKDPNDCPTVDNTGAAETAVDTCVAAIVAAIDPPPRDQTKCGAGKKKCASKYLAALLKCRKLAQTPGKPNDPNTKGCVDKAVAKYTGGLDATKGCFTKLEAKNPNDCQSTTDSPSVKALVEDCVDDLVAVVASPASTTSTTITTTTTMQPVCGPGETFVPSAGGCCLNFHLCGGNRVPLHCCPAGFFCDPGATETCITTPTTTMPTGGQCNPACILPATCVLGVCRAPCGATSCRQANPAVELCCTTSHSNGKCCEYDTPVCS